MNTIRDIHQEMIAIRRNIHQHPETGFDVQRTAKLAADKLKSFGYTVQEEVGVTGLFADLNVKGAKRRIALRADMDALPVQEENTHSYTSEVPKKAHLCGHDAHTAMLLGVAKLLKQREENLEVNVRFIFQPSEEDWPGGAPAMIKQGVLNGVDEIYALHVWPQLEVGHYGICEGPAMAQAGGFDITVKGKGGHAATPNVAINPIVVCAKIVSALEGEFPFNPDKVVTCTQIHGGASYNVIEETCKISGTVRTFEPNASIEVEKKMRELVEEISVFYEAEGDLFYNKGYPPVVNDRELANKVRQRAGDLVGEFAVHFPGKRAPFGEDFAYYTQNVKGCFIQLGCRKGEGQQMLHHPRFDIDEECLVHGAALFVHLVESEKQEG